MGGDTESGRGWKVEEGKRGREEGRKGRHEVRGKTEKGK